MISVTILTKNSAQYLQEVLTSLSRFPEVVVVDTGSEDTTMLIARQFPNVTLYQKPFIGFGPTHNMASALCKYDWILSIDSDEIASTQLVDEILSLNLDPKQAYSISRKNYYRGRYIKGCGWYPDRVVRLYNRQKTQFSQALVHEKIITDNLVTLQLHGPLLHYPYRNTTDFLSKMQHYSTLFAEQHKGKKTSSLPAAISHGLFAFFKSYFIKQGIILGTQGFEISAYNGITAYYKYLKLRDINQNS